MYKVGQLLKLYWDARLANHKKKWKTFKYFIILIVSTYYLIAYRLDNKIFICWWCKMQTWSLLKKLNFHFQTKRRRGNLHEYLCTNMTVPRWTVLTVSNIPQQRCTNNTQFMINKYFPEIAQFMSCGKIG